MYSKIIALFLFTQAAIASPWLTGPLLAPSGKTIPAGHANFEPYGFYTSYPGNFHNIEATPILTVGLTNFMDIQTSLPYDYSWVHDHHGSNIGDYSLGLGFQLLRQQENTWMPDLRFVIQEVFPTGRFENLDPNDVGTDQTGIGAYQTYLGLNFQKTFLVNQDHYLRSRLSIVGAKANDVHVRGFNAFGGGTNAEGDVNPGHSYSIDLAFEYTLTQNWVPVFEVLYAHSSSSMFSGNPGFTPGGTLASIGGSGGQQVSLAPALEYNFNERFGIIGGLWFSVTGPHAATFTTGAIAINCYF